MRILTLSAIALATALSAGVATAQNVSPGLAQLAASAGVEPGALSASQLIRLIDAQRDNDTTTVNFILSQAGMSDTMSASSMGSNVSAGDAQLARSAGVEPGQFTRPELIRLIDAQRNDNDQEVAFILSGTNRAAPSATGNAGKAQLAALLGVDANAYTLNELVALNAEMMNSNDNS